MYVLISHCTEPSFVGCLKREKQGPPQRDVLSLFPRFFRPTNPAGIFSVSVAAVVLVSATAVVDVVVMRIA